MSERLESGAVPIGDARPSHQVDDRAIDVGATQAAGGYGTEVDHAADPLVEVVDELASSAIGVEGRKEGRVRIESDKVVAQEGFHLGPLPAQPRPTRRLELRRLSP